MKFRLAIVGTLAFVCASLAPASGERQVDRCEDGSELIFGDYCPCRHASHGVERYRVDEVLTGAPGTKEWSSYSSHGKNSKSKHCESRRKSILSAYPDAVLSNPFGEFRQSGDQYSYRCKWRVQREPIYVLKKTPVCLK